MPIPPLRERPAFAALPPTRRRSQTAICESCSPRTPARGAAPAEAAGLYLDYSKNRVTDETLRLLIELAEQSDLEHRRDMMFSGERINVSEDRSVLHVALRMPKGTSLIVDGVDVVAEVHEVLDRMAAFADRVRSGEWKGHTGKPIRNIVNIGIGGSDLGPVMAYEALRHYIRSRFTFRFVSNVDSTDFVEATRDLSAEETLFIVSSKTFGTLETLTNATSARDWVLRSSETSRRSPGISWPSRPTPNGSRRSGSTPPTCSGSGTGWVAGTRWTRPSASRPWWRRTEQFHEMLAGFHAMDEHFRTAPLAENLPVLMGLLTVWYVNFFGVQSSG